MNELSIELTDINPREFFGQHQETITLIKAHFVKLKIVARGNVIKAYGDEAQL
ncbi:MAG: phosphate starvation-inducible protein PhoH, partial [Flavobacteriaceae bacterium]